ncbi:hypothetical protein TrVFT333_005284 [Trichoderma virens FT-333]|nr:hypothetical protein TrVFT333_005284 [Trichoderma virens FT-333]
MALDPEKGHTISNEYYSYKDAQRAASSARKDYNDIGNSLKVTKPYEGPAQLVGGNMYYRDGHEKMAPLAEAAAATARVEGNRRDAFNNNYGDLLQAKGQYQSHVEQAKQAHNSADKYGKYEEQHKKYRALH